MLVSVQLSLSIFFPTEAEFCKHQLGLHPLKDFTLFFCFFLLTSASLKVNCCWLKRYISWLIIITIIFFYFFFKRGTCIFTCEDGCPVIFLLTINCSNCCSGAVISYEFDAPIRQRQIKMSAVIYISVYSNQVALWLQSIKFHVDYAPRRKNTGAITSVIWAVMNGIIMASAENTMNRDWSSECLPLKNKNENLRARWSVSHIYGTYFTNPPEEAHVQNI